MLGSDVVFGVRLGILTPGGRRLTTSGFFENLLTAIITDHSLEYSVMHFKRRHCVVCGNYLDTLFEQARPNAFTCSNKCRQKRYRDRKRNAIESVDLRSNDHQDHELDEARIKRIRCFVADCLRGLNPYQVRSNKGPRGLHASPNPSVCGIDT